MTGELPEFVPGPQSHSLSPTGCPDFARACMPVRLSIPG